MARTVLLSFKDNAAAERFVRIMLAWEAGGETSTAYEEIITLGTTAAAQATVEAIVARPTSGCKCRHRGRFVGWTRSPRFGWMVCPNCNKPSPIAVRNWIKNNIIAMGGNNLLQELVPTPVVLEEVKPDEQRNIPEGVQEDQEPEQSSAEPESDT